MVTDVPELRCKGVVPGVEGEVLPQSDEDDVCHVRHVSVQVSMGFPQRGPDGPGSAVFVGAEARQLPGSYACPRWDT